MVYNLDPYPDYCNVIAVGTETTILMVIYVTCRRDRVLGVTVQLVRVTVTMTHRRLWDNSLPIMFVTERVFVLKL